MKKCDDVYSGMSDGSDSLSLHMVYAALMVGVCCDVLNLQTVSAAGVFNT